MSDPVQAQLTVDGAALATEVVKEIQTGTIDPILDRLTALETKAATIKAHYTTLIASLDGLRVALQEWSRNALPPE